MEGALARLDVGRTLGWLMRCILTSPETRRHPLYACFGREIRIVLKELSSTFFELPGRSSNPALSLEQGLAGCARLHVSSLRPYSLQCYLRLSGSSLAPALGSPEPTRPTRPSLCPAYRHTWPDSNPGCFLVSAWLCRYPPAAPRCGPIAPRRVVVQSSCPSLWPTTHPTFARYVCHSWKASPPSSFASDPSLQRCRPAPHLTDCGAPSSPPQRSPEPGSLRL